MCRLFNQNTVNFSFLLFFGFVSLLRRRLRQRDGPVELPKKTFQWEGEFVVHECHGQLLEYTYNVCEFFKTDSWDKELASALFSTVHRA